METQLYTEMMKHNTMFSRLQEEIILQKDKLILHYTGLFVVSPGWVKILK